MKKQHKALKVCNLCVPKTTIILLCIGGDGMKVFIEIAKHVYTSMGDMICMIMGGLDDYLYALAVLMVVDSIIWLIATAVGKKLSREAIAKQILKKVVICNLVVVGEIMDIYILKNRSILRTMVIRFYLFSESISILQNSSAIGLPIPNKLKALLEKLQEK